MDRYPPIAEHGLVDDLQTAALVSSQGIVDWFAAPRFDSPSIFAALLDHNGGGYIRLAPEHPDGTCKQLYYPDTAILITRFMSPDGVGEVVDFMPLDQTGTATDRHTLIRLIRAVRGTVEFTLECRPRFDYGRAEHQLELDDQGALFRAPGIDGHLQTTFPLERDGQDVRGSVTLNSSEFGGAVFTVCSSSGEAPAPPTADGLIGQMGEVSRFWQHWLRQSRYRGRWPELVHRSAITLKLPLGTRSARTAMSSCPSPGYWSASVSHSCPGYWSACAVAMSARVRRPSVRERWWCSTSPSV
ncbi:trehalase-like domain-containing protein [Streptomyces atratus]|uniref:trehalase-like domain-containing protein n=1 Tax=Streptomyces TaxID=1883 RepID=UPI0037A7FB73